MKELRGKIVTDEEVLQEIAERCRKDDVFRVTLRKNPKAVLEGLGVMVPHGLELEVRGDTPATECLYMSKTDELTDEDLNKVAGGLSNLNITAPSFQRIPMPLYGIA